MGTAFLAFKHRLWSNRFVRLVLRGAVTLLAHAWRIVLFRTRVVAITGSLGKTTTKELLGAILRPRASVTVTRHNQNDRFGVPRTVLRIRPWNDLAVVEVGVSSPGQMRGLARLLRPNVAVVLGVGATHTQEFRDLDSHAAEKAILFDFVRPEGTRVLNGDDPRAESLSQHGAGRLRLFGTGPDCEIRADCISAAWPGRLEFRVTLRGISKVVRTQLVGKHWLPSVLAALAAADSLGVPLEEASEAIERMPPFPARLSPVQLPSGAIMLRDDYNASVTALDAGLDVLSSAQARRKILVISDFSDSGFHRRTRLAALAQRVLPVADAVLLVGSDFKAGCRRLQKAGFDEDSTWGAATIAEAVELLRKELKESDLVLLKGRTTDHLARVCHALLGPIRCDRTDCKKTVLCDFCPLL